MTEAVTHPRILMVDDNKKLCNVFREMCRLQRWNVRVDACHDGSSAIDLLLDESTREEPFDLVVADVFLPKNAQPEVELEALGVKLLTTYQLVRPGTPIIVMTAFPTFDACVRCIKAGAYDYLPKGDPSNQDSFLKVLVEKCQTLLRPSPDPLVNWLGNNRVQISKKFGGQHIAILETTDVSRSKIPWVNVGEKAIIAGATMRELRLRILQDPALRWTEPNILQVSVA